ncbi:MAG: hypothetical protein ACFE9I_04370 [Candidatus Hermodarchaeota archaeon]
MILQGWWTLGLGLVELLIFIILIIVISLLINALFLKIALSVVKSARHTDFGEVFVTALIIALVGWIPCLGCILSWVIINSRHETGFGMAIVVWIIAILVGLIITVLLVIFIIGIIGITVTIPFI